MFSWKRLILILFLISATALIIIVLRLPRHEVVFGVGFSPSYARYLGLDPRQAYEALFKEWNFKYVRIPVEWDAVESKPDLFDWAELDWMMDTANRHGARVMLVVGQKTPRWPECHIPKWTEALSAVGAIASGDRNRLLHFMTKTVERYRRHRALELWQVENEPLLTYGICPKFTKSDLDEELALVRRLDPAHQTIDTDSGELSSWIGTARAGDFFGTTVYRIVWNKFWRRNFTYFWHPAALYRLKLWLNGRDSTTAYVTELQAEPWIPNASIHDVPLKTQYETLNLEQLKYNVDFVKKIGLPRAYLWGAEWWYWLKEKKGAAEISEYVKTLRKE